MLGLVRRSGFREYFHPIGGQGYGASGFSWTAALVIDVLHRDRQLARDRALSSRWLQPIRAGSRPRPPLHSQPDAAIPIA